MTLDSSACFDICPECGWEDDGQDDSNADKVLGGPNGDLSLTEARAIHAAYLAESEDADSFARGGKGSWQTEVDRLMEQRRRSFGHE